MSLRWILNRLKHLDWADTCSKLSIKMLDQCDGCGTECYQRISNHRINFLVLCMKGLTLFFPMLSYDSPENIRKPLVITLVFWCFTGYNHWFSDVSLVITTGFLTFSGGSKGNIGKKRVKTLSRAFSWPIKYFHKISPKATLHWCS